MNPKRRTYVTLAPYSVHPTASAGWGLSNIVHALETIVTAPITAPYNIGKSAASGDWGAAAGYVFDPGGVASAANTLSDGKLKEWGSWVGNKAGDGALWLYEHDPVFQLGYKLASGENVWVALQETGTIVLSDVKIFGPYVAYIPGIGTAAGMALAAGIALASGKRLDEIAIEAARGAIPPGPALMAFDAANALVHGKGLEGAAIEALKGELPEEARGAVDAAMSILQGGNVLEATIGAVRDALPPEAKVALDTGVAIAKGKKVTEAIEDGVRGILPPEYQAVFDAARDIANGKNVLEVAINTARAELPPDARKILDIGVTIAKGGSVQDVLISAARAAIPDEYVQYFDLAMSLTHTDKSQVIAAIKAQIPPGTSPDQVYAMAKGAMGAGASASTGGMTHVGMGVIVNVALETAIASAKAQLPDDALVRAAFDAGVQIVRGKSLEDVAAAVAADVVPPEYQDALNKGVSATKAVIHGDNLGDVAYNTFKDQLPPEMQGYAELGLGLVKGEKSVDAALAAAKALIPENLLPAYDAAIGLASPTASFRDKLYADVKAQISPGQTLQDAQAQAMDLANRLFPTDVIDSARASLSSPELQAAFDTVRELVKGKAVGQIASDIVKEWIPEQYKDTFRKAAAIADHANPSEIALSVMRSQVPMSVQHSIDGAAAVFKGKAPEEMARDPLAADVISAVMAKKRESGEIPQLPGTALNRINIDSIMNKGAIDLRADLRQAVSARIAGFGMELNRNISFASDSIQKNREVVQQMKAVDPEEAKFNQLLQDIANRRVALGDANPYQGPAFDPGFQELLDKLVAKKINAKKPKTQALVATNDASAATSWMLPVAAVAVVGIGGGAYYWMKKHPRAKGKTR